MKRHLFKVTEFERSSLESLLAELEKVAIVEMFIAIKVFYRAADMCGQIYMVKDLTSKSK